jgi:hypothetical protein
MVVRISSKSRGKCLACSGQVGLVRRLTNRPFCCDTQELLYLEELKDMGVARLRAAGIRLRTLRLGAAAA